MKKKKKPSKIASDYSQALTYIFGQYNINNMYINVRNVVMLSANKYTDTDSHGRAHTHSNTYAITHFICIPKSEYSTRKLQSLTFMFNHNRMIAKISTFTGVTCRNGKKQQKLWCK